jgi:hypothetical protein
MNAEQFLNHLLKYLPEECRVFGVIDGYLQTGWFFFHTEGLAKVWKECGESDFVLTSHFWIPWKGRGF